MANIIGADELRRSVGDGGEFALLDVRERGQYAREHLFLAINLPLSHLELRMRRFVPRLSARVLLCDAGNGLSERAAGVMEAAGYDNISIIAGGVGSCAAAGMELFRGHYATTYAFGLYVERCYRPPRISPRELKAKLDDGESIVVVDSRLIGEFSGASIPGAMDVPLAELVHRIRDVAPDPDTRVVVNCGAITRGVLGACSLIEAGVENPVAVLTNGVRGWDLADLPLAHGAVETAGPVSPMSAAWAVKAARHIARQTDVSFITAANLDEWRRDAKRTLYVVDVRTRDEYEAGHLADAVWIPGGELVGLYEDHIGTLNARICLVDDEDSRAIVTASWLNRMGWPDVAVLEGGLGAHELVMGPDIENVPALHCADIPGLTPVALAKRLEQQSVLVIDFASSASYAQGHIPGAWWTVRSSLPGLVSRIPDANEYVVTSEDGRLAVLAATDLRELSGKPVATLSGGTEAWRAAGFELVSGMTRPLGETDDCLAELAVRPGDDRTTALDSQRRLVRWQEGLLAKVERDNTFSFPELPPQ